FKTSRQKRIRECGLTTSLLLLALTRTGTYWVLYSTIFCHVIQHHTHGLIIKYIELLHFIHLALKTNIKFYEKYL
ncbi:hypothetical protein Q6293_29620, partial [Klebsiella pneumoniae]|uniref:hypothetical protein n=1 Tax=Klebsiella pneumoniae TaxID=573 RepID=UPI00272FED8C